MCRLRKSGIQAAPGILSPPEPRTGETRYTRHIIDCRRRHNDRSSLRLSLPATVRFAAGMHRVKPRIMILPLAAILITLAVVWKLQQTYPPPDPNLTRYLRRPAPSFEATEVTASESSGFFRLERYLGRQAVLLVFFDGEQGGDASPVLQHLKSHAETIEEQNILVVAVSSALPQHNRTLNFPDSFRFVTDLPPVWDAHRRWNCFDDADNRPLEKVFFIDRAGRVPIDDDGLPVPLEDERAEIDRILGLDSHGTDSSAD